MSATRTRCLLSIQPASDGGGSETALLPMLRQLVDEGWTCHVVLPSAPRLGDEYAATGATVHILAMRRITTSADLRYWLVYGLAWPVTVLRLALLARRSRVDLVHSNSLHSWYGWAVALLVRRPHVWHAREIVTQSAAALRVERSLAKRFAVRVIAISAAVAAQLDPGNVTVVADEPDPAVWSPSLAGRFRGELGIADDAPLVGSVARLDTWKGVDVLLDAVPLIRARVPDVVFVVAGPSVAGKEAYAAGLASRAAALARDGALHWLGHRRDVPELMADLDVFAQVSTTPEPFGLVLAEALASGVPVVAGNEGGPVELLAGAGMGGGRGDGGAPMASVGVLVRPGDPGALAGAVVDLLGRGPLSTSERRRQRKPLLARRRPRWGVIFSSALR